MDSEIRMKQIMEAENTPGGNQNSPLLEQQLQYYYYQQTQQYLQCSNNYNDHARIISRNDISVGDLVASGSFASVYKVCLVGGLQATEPSSSGNNMCDVDMMDDVLFGEPFEYTERMVTSSRHSYNSVTTSSQKPYALKRLSVENLNTPSKVCHGVKGMIFEAHLLSNVLSQRPHPNIVRMYGMSPNFMSDPINGFLILEYLVETLDQRLSRWMSRQTMRQDKAHHHTKDHHNNGHSGYGVIESCQRLFDVHNTNKKNATLREQLTRTKYIGYGIANALRYLHDNHVLYRDLKPSNVGFDERGTVKLFDFDLSRQYYDVDVTDGPKNLTPCIGSLRYMSPECAQGKPYSFSSDVHSYAILLWEICTIQRPYVNVLDSSALVKVAFFGNERPSLRKIVSPEIRQLLQKGWNPNPSIRPTMSSIVDTLRSLHRPSSCSGGIHGSPTLRKLMSRRKNG